MASGVQALVGTRKGLFLLWGDDDRRGWRAEGPLLDGWGVYHATVDARDGTLYAAANHIVYGPTIQRSADGGKTWERSKKIGLPEWSGLTVNAVWHIEPGLPQEPGTLYLGRIPACCSAPTMPGKPGNRIAAFSSTPPAIALADSPAGLAAWFYDKFADWTYSGGDPERSLTKDEMLDDISLYWFTRTQASSARLYWENHANTFNAVDIRLPAAITVFPGEIYRAPRSWARRCYHNLIYFHEVDRGGHFAAWEEPEVFAAEIWAAFRSLR